MKFNTKILALALMAGGTMFAQSRVSIGVGVGVGGGYAPGYAPAYAPDYYGDPAYAQQYMPPSPGPGYTWVDGYWSPVGGRRVWTTGFWRAPIRDYRVAPRYYNSFRDDHRRYDRDDRYRDRDRDHDRRDNGNRFRR